MTQKIIYYLALALAWLLPIRLMVGILAVTQLFTLIIVGTVIQDFISRNHDKEEN